MNDNVLIERIICFIAIMILFMVIFVITYDSRNINSMKKNLADLINLGQKIVLIEDYIKSVLDEDLYVKVPIKIDTKLTVTQINLLHILYSLENLHEKWQYYVDKSFISNSNIKMPYAIAYHIRELIIEDFYEEDEEKIWLNKEEINCLVKYNNSSVKPEKKLDHIIVCIKCRESLNTN